MGIYTQQIKVKLWVPHYLHIYYQPVIVERWKSNPISVSNKNVDATVICALHVETRTIKDCT
jgi:hypothetical protein